MSKALPAPKAPKEKSQPALDLLDEAFHRLRAAPLAVLGIYYAGSLPFILGLLYFWADLSHSADAERYGEGAAGGLALLYLWMKFCHAVFARRMRAICNRSPARPWSAGGVLNILIVQSVLQSAGLFVLLAGAVLTLPLGWAYAFCQSATAIGAGEKGTVREVFARSVRASFLWPRQNHMMLLIASLLAMFVWLNILMTVFGLPYLLKLATGEDNLFTRGGVDFFNSAFMAVTFSLVYLLLDPVMKTFYVLRCFYSESQLSGEDLKSELRALPPVDAPAPNPGGSGAAAPGIRPASRQRPVAAAVAALVAMLCFFNGFLPPAAHAAPAPAPVTAPSANIQAPELDKSIEEVMHRREFAWRVPPPAGSDLPADKGFFGSTSHWLEDVATAIFKPLGHAWNTFWHWVGVLKDKLFPANKDEPAAPVNAGSWFNGGDVFLQRLLYALIAAIVIALLWVSWKAWRRRDQSPDLAGKAAPGAAFTVSDLNNEEVLATQLPEDEWLQLARRLLETGEHRLALRAFYLSILALLGTRGLLAVARHKSNRDYLAELRRRARGGAELQMAFTRNVSRYERVWYGPHPASQDVFDQFLADRQIICEAALPAPAPPALA